MVKIKWRQTEGTQDEKPSAIDKESSKKVVYIRKNIKRVVKTVTENGENKTTRYWQYDEAALTLKEYAEYEELLAEIESPAMQQLKEENSNLAAALADVYEKQDRQDEKLLGIMAALADLYEQSIEREG